MVRRVVCTATQSVLEIVAAAMFLILMFYVLLALLKRKLLLMMERKAVEVIKLIFLLWEAKKDPFRGRPRYRGLGK
jgi:hypothetical protein